MKKLLSIAVVSTLLLSSCTKHRLKGEGAIVSDTRYISSFYTLQSEGEAEVDIYPSNTNKVIVSGYQNLVSAFETNVADNKLTLKFRDKYFNIKNNNIKVTVYSTNVNMIRINGSGSITLRDSVASKTMQAEINGSGNIFMSNNLFDNLNMKINGSGEIYAKPAAGKYVRAEISGSGDIQTTVLETLDAKISGSGNIYYSGNPKTVNISLSGSGKVKKN